ncbi:MAG: hypothetical protein PHD74_10225, partial [Candidatus Krumholzibacteria bacterium]|nr:hypothetical protein [Candidatus Krumholzibacteria bacterium]
MTDERKDGREDRIDFSCLDPRASAEHFEDLVRGIRLAAIPELERRSGAMSLWGQIVRWRRPVAVLLGLLGL